MAGIYHLEYEAIDWFSKMKTGFRNTDAAPSSATKEFSEKRK